MAIRLRETAGDKADGSPHGSGLACNHARDGDKLGIITNYVKAQAHATLAEEGLLPIFQSQPGFKGYTVVATGEKIISFSAWESADSAEKANAAAAAWVGANLANELELKDSQIGEVLFSNVLGVSTLDRTHA